MIVIPECRKFSGIPNRKIFLQRSFFAKKLTAVKTPDKKKG